MSEKTMSTAVEPRSRHERHSVRFSLFDFLSFFVILAGVNYFVSPRDVGWFAVNPTPFLLIPALLGVRYGFSAGLSAGLLTALFLLVGRHVLSHGISLVDHRYTLITLPIFGALVGQVAEGLRRRRLLLEGETAQLNRQNRHLDAERELLLLSRQDLQQRLGLFGAEAASVDEELQELSETSREFAPAQLLSTLGRITRARSAALYVVPQGSRPAPLSRAASMGDSSKFPESLELSDHQIIEEALSNKTFLIQKSLLELTPSRTPGYLAAYPITGVENFANYVLVIQDVPFNDIKPNTFDVMKSICDWMKFALARPLHHEARHRALSQSDFYQAMEAAVTTHGQQAIPSTLVRVPFDFEDDLDPTECFRELLEALPRTTILSNSHEGGVRSLLFLLPANSDPELRDAMRTLFTAFCQDLGLAKDAEPHFVMTSPGETPQQLWGKLVIVNQNVAPN
jgi:hypothetical protein